VIREETRMMNLRLHSRRLAAGAALLALSVVCSARAERPDSGAVLRIRMSGFRSDRGRAMVALFAGPAGFPVQTGRAFRSAWATIRGGQALVVLDRLPAATYALAILHDENGNGKMDTDWLGRPREGRGASNNARGAPPKFEAARFVLGSPQREVSITVVY
jgi:uncharacterized protein (DUF2141 family)